MTDGTQVFGVRLLVDDFAEMFRFYRDLLGLVPAAGNGEPPYVELAGGDSLIALFDRRLMQRALGLPEVARVRSGADAMAIILRVPDVDRSYAELQGKGVAFLAPPTDRPDWSLRTAHLRDPEGNLVEIYHDLPPGSRT